MSDVKGAEDESVFLLHACAHNPTGVDPNEEQWKELSQLMKAKKHIAFFDCAYQVLLLGYSTPQELYRASGVQSFRSHDLDE